MDINASDSEEVKSNKLDELAKRSHIGNINPIRYRGYYYDVESNLYYLNTRYYDPQSGRFINADEITILDETQSDIHGLNLYMYCGNNPVMNIDPSGRAFFSFLIGLFVLSIAAGVMSGISSGIQSQAAGGSFGAGFVGGFISGSLTAAGTMIGAYFGVPKIGAFVGGFIGGTAGSLVTDHLNGKNIGRNQIGIALGKGVAAGLFGVLTAGIAGKMGNAGLNMRAVNGKAAGLPSWNRNVLYNLTKDQLFDLNVVTYASSLFVGLAYSVFDLLPRLLIAASK